MSFNKGVLDAYRKIVTKDIVTRTLLVTGSANIGGNLYVTGSIIAGGGGLGTGDMLKSVYDVANSGSVDNSNKLDNLNLSEVRTHAPASHSGSHATGGGDAISIFKTQVRDINDFNLVAPQLSITGSTISSISGSVIITGSISGSDYYGPVMHIRTGSIYTFGRRRLNVVSGGAMIINMTEDPVNDEVVLTLQSTGSGGAGTGLADTVVGGLTYGQNSGSGTASSVSRSDHTHGTPSLSLANAQDAGATASSGSIATGSKVDHVHRGVLSFANSGSSDLYTRVYLTGSTGIISTQAGQVIKLVTDPTNLNSANITASVLLSGSDVHAPTASIDALTSIGVTSTTISGSVVSGSSYIGDAVVVTNITATNITGSTISGSALSAPVATITNINTTNITGSIISGSTAFRGPLVNVTNIVAVNITGSTILSGANVYSPVATITNINATNITGSTLSGSVILGATATITNINASNVTGSFLSGSDIHAPIAQIDNISVVNLTGSGIISGSTIYASNLQVPNFSPTGIVATTITGSSTVSGSTVYATTFSGSKMVLIGDISGSSYSGPVVSVRTGSDTTTYARKRLNFINSGGMIINVADDPTNSEIQVQLQASVGGITPSDSVVNETAFGQLPVAGTSITLARGDHTHGSPSLSTDIAQNISDTATAGTVNTGSRVDHIHRGVASIGYSGSSPLYGIVNVTGSTNVTVAQGTQSLTVSLPTSITLTNVTGSTLLSGSAIRGATAIITNITATNITGSLLSGSDHRGPTATITSINATTITGSTSISGSVIYGANAVITNVNVTNITGSIISGSTLYANIATIQNFTTSNLTATNVTGSTSISGSNVYGNNASLVTVNSTSITATNITATGRNSGSDFRGPTATITNVNATNITGSLLSGSDHRGPTATITNVYVTNLTGSGTVSGSLVRGSDITGSHIGANGNIVAIGNISGSSISGSITMNMDGNARVTVRQNSGGSGYTRRRINLIEGTGITLNIGDDVVNEEVDVTITSTGGTATSLSGSKGPYTYIVFSGSAVGGPYFAKNSDGTAIYSGSEAYLVLKNAINAASTASGSVYVKAAKYALSQNIDPTFKNVDIIGEQGAYIYLKNGLALDMNHQVPIDAVDMQNCNIRGLTIDGNYLNNDYLGATPALIRMEGNCHNVNIENNTLINARMYTILAIAYTNNHLYNVNIKNNLCNGGFYNSIYYLAWDTTVTGSIMGCEVTGNDVSNFADIGICIGQAISGNITDINVHDNKVHDGTTNGTLGSGGGTNSVFGIRFEGDVLYSQIIDNNIWGVRSPIGDDGVQNIIQGNKVRSDLSGATDTIGLFGSGSKCENNTIFTGYTGFFSGVQIYGDGNKIAFNNVINLGPAGNCGGISENGNPVNTTIIYNDTRGCQYPINTGSGAKHTIVGNLTV